MKNYLNYTLALVLLTLLVLLLMNYLPSIKLGGSQMRVVDLLGDVRKVELKVDSAFLMDTIPFPTIVKPAFVDSCKQGMTCIEDYGDSTGMEMAHFYEALTFKAERKEPIRIAVFGDSFIEADIFTADLRELLQKKFGGRGVGFIPITSLVYGFRPTVYHRFSGWDTHTVTASVYFDYAQQGISGHYYKPNADAYIELRGQKKYASLLDTAEVSTIYFKNKDSLTLDVQINGKEPMTFDFQGNDKLWQAKVEDKIGKIKWTVKESDSLAYC